MNCAVVFLFFLSSCLLMSQPCAAVVGIEKDASTSATEVSKYIVVLQRHLTKDHYAELVSSVREQHDDPSNRRFAALVSSEMKNLKMFTVSNPTKDALTFLRDHEYVKTVEADGVVYAARDEM